MEREQWGSRLGFILAAVGSAIGLGNIWRFPYMAFDNGGGAFLIPYFFALLTAGIPILIMEFSIGHKMKGSAPVTFTKMRTGWQWLGWWQILISFVITIYYVAVIGWAINYFFFSFTRAWGADTIGFFVGDYLGLSEGPFVLGGIRGSIMVTVLFTWLISFVAIFFGVKKGIERANKIFMPLLIIMLLVIVVRGVTLPGAAIGLDLLFKPDFSKIFDAKVWVAAYGQIFYSLSIAFAIMITYSSYLPKKSDIVNNAFMTGLLNCGFSILAAIGIFSIMGFMIHTNGELPAKLSGVFLAFATIPEAVNQMPTQAAAITVGVLFFMSLCFAGLSSFISINEAVVSALVEKLGQPRRKVTVWYTLVAAALSLVYTTGAGLYILDIVDHFIMAFGVAASGIVEVILVAYVFKLTRLKEHFQPISDFKVGRWWDITIKIVTPLVLGVTFVQNLIGNIKAPYEGYSIGALMAFGWSIVVGIIIVGVALGQTRWADPSILKVEE